MSVDRVRIGVIGTSGIADLVHLPALKSHPHAEVVAVCGRNGERCGALAAKYGVRTTYSDYRSMLEREKLDAVLVATPDDLHYEMAMAAMDAGLHVLCEKPLAFHAEQAREMQARAEQKRLVTMTFFTYRWSPVYRYARDVIKEGFVGRPSQCSLRYLSGHGRTPDRGWRFDAERSCGVLADLGSHMIDLAQWLVGDITAVCGRVNSRWPRKSPALEPIQPANDEALFLMELDGGATGSIQLSAIANVADRAQEQHVVIHGDGGTIECEMLAVGGMAIRGVRGDEREFRNLTTPPEYWGRVQPSPNLFEVMPALFRELGIGTRLFVESVARGQPVTPSFTDGLRAQSVVDAVLRSSQSGRWESVRD